jgi:hypothetical protein
MWPRDYRPVKSGDIPLWRGCDGTTVGGGECRRAAKKNPPLAAADFSPVSAIADGYFDFAP